MIPLAQVIRHLEDAGEVNVTLAEHDATKSENGSITYQVKHDVAFVLDPLSNKKRKKAWHLNPIILLWYIQVNPTIPGSRLSLPHIVLTCAGLGDHVWSSNGLPKAAGKQECGHLVANEAGCFMLFTILTRYIEMTENWFIFCFCILQHQKKEQCNIISTSFEEH